MKIRQFTSAAVLTLALSISTLAGELWVPAITNPPPPDQGGRASTSSTKSEVTGLDTLTETATILCLRMLSFF